MKEIYCSKRMGYYWPAMLHDFIRQHLESLYPTMASWRFEVWGQHVVGSLTPKYSASHLYILTNIDYFSTWAEAIVLKEVKKENAVDFIQMHII